MNNFLNLDNFTTREINNLIKEALIYKNDESKIPCLNKYVASMFLEPSTRTKTSFEIAALKSGCKVINIEQKTSALQKGETLEDTLLTLESLGVSSIIIRSEIDYYYKDLNTNNIKIINAGDGVQSHPSQCLLDLVTIYEQFETIEGLKILIMGDVLHSRVARSNINIMKKMGMEVLVYAPSIYKSDDEFNYIDNLEETLKSVDCVMLLRNQLERHHNDEINIQTEYLKKYGLTKKRSDLLKPNAIIMHPGPFNRDVEIESSVLSDKRCKINTQVTNGVYARIAILNYVLGEK